MRTKTACSGLLVGSLLIVPATRAQSLVNGDFETGTLAPWVVTPTANGVSLVTGVGPYDIDGPGPLVSSSAGRFMVGRNGPVPTWEGIELTQPVELEVGTPYRLWLRWSVKPIVNVYGESGGRFEMIVGGQVIQTATAPAVTPALVPSYGLIHTSFTVPQAGTYQVGVRITRPVPAGEEVFQYIDYAGLVKGYCYCDCNHDTLKNISDFGCFQTKFVLGDPYADLNGSGTFTIADFGAWRAAFATSSGIPCP